MSGSAIGTIKGSGEQSVERIQVNCDAKCRRNAGQRVAHRMLSVNDADLMGSDNDSVYAKWGEVVNDELGNPTRIGIVCDRDCRKRAANFNKFTSNDISMGVMRTSYLSSQRNVAQGFYQVAEKSSYVFLATEMVALSAARWAFMSASEKVAYLSIVGGPITYTNGGGAALAVDDASIWLYQSVKSLRPHMKVPAGAGKPVARSDGKGGYHIE